MRNVCLLTALTVGLWVLSANAPLAATVSWSVSRVSETLTTGTEKTIEVRFRSDATYPQVIAMATPSLGSSLTVTPNAFAVQAGTDYVLTLKLTLPADVKGAIVAGTLHLRDSTKSTQTIGEPLQIRVMVDRSPEEMVRSLAKAFRSGSDDDILDLMSPSSTNIEFVARLTPRQRTQFADFFESAKLVDASGRYRVYEGTLTMGDGAHVTQFGIGVSKYSDSWFLVNW